jgi:hypothetical protein
VTTTHGGTTAASGPVEAIAIKNSSPPKDDGAFVP